MRKNLFFCFILLCSLSFITSCKDDDNTPEINYSEKIAGTYKGNLDLSFSNVPTKESTIQKIYITSLSENVAKLELKDFQFSNIPVGNITLQSVTITPVENNNTTTYSLSGEQDLTIMNGSMEVHVVLTGEIINSQLKLNITIKDVIGVGDITVKFEGVKMESDNENTEAFITSFSVKDENLICSYIDDENKLINLYVTSIPHPFKLTPTITVSEGATLSPASETEIDFQNNDVTYNVKAQDNIHSNTYTVKCIQHANIEIKDVNLAEENALFGQPYIKDNEIILFVNAGNNGMKYSPTFTLSANTNISPASGSIQDFTNGSIKYTITATDNEHVFKEYTVTIKQNNNKFSFEEWVVKNVTESGKESKEPLGGWASTNTAVALLISMEYTSDFSVVPSTDKKDGEYAAELKTLDTKGEFFELFPGYGYYIPKVTAGSLFLGNFNTDNIMGDQMLCTQFGVPFYQKPSHFKGSYKYTPGETYYNCPDPTKSSEVVVDNGKTDSPAINAILYEVDSYSETLTGKDILTSDKIVAIAQAADNETHTAFKDFDITFNYLKTYDPSKKYKLAIVCSSSKDGDKFCGAPGSTLIVDEFEIVTE